jgi:hypothetical protein
MAVTMHITSYHGYSAGAPTSQGNVEGTTIRFKQADNDTVDANNPIPIPAAGTNYSNIKQFRFNIDAAGGAPSNLVNNLKVYSDGGNGLGTGVDLLVRTSATYLDPAAQGTTLLSSTTTIFGYTSGSPLAVTGSSTTTGAFGDYVQMQMSVASTATQGTTPSETVTFSYDES